MCIYDVRRANQDEMTEQERDGAAGNTFHGVLCKQPENLLALAMPICAMRNALLLLREWEGEAMVTATPTHEGDANALPKMIPKLRCNSQGLEEVCFALTPHPHSLSLSLTLSPSP